MNHRQVAEAFANGRTSAKGCNMFIDGDTIYSYGYHFPIARRTDKFIDGQQVVLFTRAGYSVSTSKHISYTRFALSQSDYKVIDVMDLRNRVEDASTDLINYSEKMLDKASRCRKDHTRDFYNREAEQARENARLVSTVVNA